LAEGDTARRTTLRITGAAISSRSCCAGFFGTGMRFPE
jgi:hypothetical protein